MHAIVDPMPVEEARIITARSNPARIIAAGIVIAFCYFASSVLVTLLVAILMAYFLDPMVTWLEDHVRMPRPLGSLLIVLLTLALLVAMGWLLVERLDQFGNDWPKYRQPLRSATETISSKLQSLEADVSEIEPPPPAGPVLTIADTHPVRTALLGRLSSLYSLILGATFVPFLVFFMLAGKRQVWHATMQLFPATQRTNVKETLAEVTLVLRSYLVGTALVGIILVAATWFFFWMLGLDFPFLTALVSGLCNLVPYLGAVMSWVPPLLVGLTKYHSAPPFIGIFSMLTFFHVIAANFLVPLLIGWRMRLNAVALTVSLLFWGWMWGAMGFILAIPIAAVIKVICDHVEGWEQVGHWLSS